MHTGVRALAWSDEPDSRWNVVAANTLAARVVPPCDDAIEIVLQGKCPRCRHPIVLSQPIREVMTDSEKTAALANIGLAPAARFETFRVTAECSCIHDHPETPGGRSGCGVPFAVWVFWSKPTCTTTTFGRFRRWVLWRPSGVARAVAGLLAAAEPTPLDIAEARELRRSADTQLADVRKTAESWRAGLAGFLAILIAVFFIKGKTSFDQISSAGWWKTGLVVLLFVSATLALVGAYSAVRAASGVPRDEYLGKVPGLFRHLPASSPRYIRDYGTIGAWRHAMARTAVNDLRWAKLATIGSLVAIAAATGLTWYAPGPPEPAFAEVTYQTPGTTATICGKSAGSRAGAVTIQPAVGKAQTFQVSTIISVKVVASCP